MITIAVLYKSEYELILRTIGSSTVQYASA